MCILVRILYNLISILDKIETRSTPTLNDKFIHSRNLGCLDMSIKTDTGYHPVSYIHQTIPYKIYRIKTKYSNLILDCADDHLIYLADMSEPYKKNPWPNKPIMVKNLKVGNYIKTMDSFDEVLSIEIMDSKICMCDISVESPDHTYYSNGILSHNTTTSAIFLLHYILFNTDKNALVLGNKRKTAIEILDKIKKIFYEIPHFLKPGVYKWNEGEIAFDNGCRIMAEATTINSGIGFTFHCVLSDEFAHIPPNILDSFYSNIFPVVTAGRARFIISSTQNGFNLFYTLWAAAVNGNNEYKPFKVDWYQVPEWNPERRCWEKRDERWKQIQIGNYGSEESFNRQFGTNFESSSETLISTKNISKAQSNSIQFINKDIPGVSHSDRFFWHPNFEPMNDLRNNFFVVTVDIAEGVGGDSTVFEIYKMEKTGNLKKPVKYVCVGYFASNELNVEVCAGCLREICCLYFPKDKYLISIESNLFGDLFYKCAIEPMEDDENLKYLDKFSNEVFVKFYNEKRTTYSIGVRIKNNNKLLGCNEFKQQYESGIIENESTAFVFELCNFAVANGGNTYKASVGHDDLVMAGIQLTYLKDSIQFMEFLETFLTVNEVDVEEGNYNAFELPSYNLFDTGDSSIYGVLNDIPDFDYFKRLK